jgi:hypothetical protein
MNIYYGICYSKNTLEYIYNNQSLVGSVVIDVKFGMEDHSSNPCNCDWKGAGTT